MAKLGKKWRPYFQAIARKRDGGASLLTTPEVALETVDRALEKAGTMPRSSRLRAALADVKTLGRLASAWARRDYRKVSTSTIVLTLSALVYFLSPLDAVLDGLPFVGFLDDAAVLAWVISEIRAELEDFRAWEQAQAQTPH